MNGDAATADGERNAASSCARTTPLGFVERLQRRRSQWDTAGAWQTQLFNKHAAKSFAANLNVPVPRLYWFGNAALALPLPELPNSFVIKPAHGHSAKGVVPVVEGINSVTGNPFAWTDAQAAFGGKGGTLIEEYIRTHASPYEVLEYKVFAFGDCCVVRVNHDYFDHARQTIKTHWHSFFTERWELISETINRYAASGPNVPRPERLDLLLGYARRLARGYATFVRVDFYLSPTSVVFGEFCPFPWNGQHFTDFGNHYFGALWEQHLGDKI